MGARDTRNVDWDDEPTHVRPLSREAIEALMRDADELEACAPRPMESGIRLAGSADEGAVVASVTPPPVPRALEDEIARLLDFDWEAFAALAERQPESDHESLALHRPPATPMDRPAGESCAFLLATPPPPAQLEPPGGIEMGPPRRRLSPREIALGIALTLALAAALLVALSGQHG